MSAGTEPRAAHRVAIGDFVFDRSTGEIRPLHPTSDIAPEARRLPPQPAKLLGLLIDRAGGLVTREEIRDLLWPEVNVDLDQSLAFCVRQIRDAFGDSASRPTYLETLPKRGYRLIPAVAPVDAEPSPASLSRQGAATSIRPRIRTAALIAAALLLSSVAVVVLRAQRPADPDPIRLAIMPFELAGEPEELALISESLLAEIATQGGQRLEVVGPRSTARYSAFPFPDMQALSSDLAIDYVINGRYMELRGEVRFVIELIRLDDGAHPWVETFSDTEDWQSIVALSRAGVLESLGVKASASVDAVP